MTPGDTLISIGDKNALRKLAELLRGWSGALRSVPAEQPQFDQRVDQRLRLAIGQHLFLE